LRLLLDTHALIWWLTDDPRLPSPAKQMVRDPHATILVSAASAWEIATKFRLDKMPGVALIVPDVEGYVLREGFLSLAVTMHHAQLAGSLPGHHKDPFDRMLIAQALVESCTLVSNEAVFDRYGVTRTW